MSKTRFHSVIGLAGVDDDETPAAILWGKRLEWPIIIIALWIVVQWYLEARGFISDKTLSILDWFVWMFFVFETVLLTSLVRNKWRYLITNWVNPLIILAGLPILFGGAYAGALRSLRLLLLAGLLFHVSDSVKNLLSRNHLGITLGISLFFIIISGVLIAGIDPAVDSVWDGIWWAWVTVTTVGYGDIVPVSPAGKIFGAILILFGIGLFSMIIASFSAFFISKDEQQEIQNELLILEKLKHIEKRIENIERHVKKNNDH